MVWCSLVLLWPGLARADEVKKIEPELVTAFEGALKKLPKPLWERVGDVQLKRAEDLAIGKEFPLEYRLLNRAAYASFSVGYRELTVYDAGALNRPSWAGGGPKREELVKLLAGVADVLGVEAPASGEGPVFEAAWKEFVKRVYSWNGSERPAQVPAIDDGEFWNRFLGDGVWHLMGGKASMEQLMFHEFGHALQLESGSMSLRMGYWGELSGFTETKDGKATDGFVGGMQKLEETMVLIRILMAEDPEKSSRGEMADYQSKPKARFVNRYARYDLREDYAESFRLMGYDPGRLAKLAPEKFLYLNALGWNARLDLENPGPLWYSGEELERYLPKAEREELFSRLMGKDGKGPALGPLPMAALLRAHAGELSKDELPEPFPIMKVPDDLPKEIEDVLGRATLPVEVDGEAHVASPERQRAQQDEMVKRRAGRFAIKLMLLRYSEHGEGGLAGVYEKDIAGKENFAHRAIAYEALREYGEKKVSSGEMKKWDEAEAKAQQKAGKVWVAARYSILTSEKSSEDLYKEIEDLAQKGEKGFERARFIGTAVDLALRDGDAAMVKTRVAKIPGKTLGKWLRVKYLVRAAKAFDGDEGKAFLKQAEDEVEKCDFSGLKSELEDLLKSK